MAQRQTLPVDPNDPYESYQAVLRGEVVQRTLTLNGLFGELKEAQRNHIIEVALDELRDEVARLRSQQSLFAEEADDFYLILRSTHLTNRSALFNNVRFSSDELISLIRRAHELIKTSPNIDTQVNPVFAERINDFEKLINNYKSERRDHLYDGICRVGYALVAAAFTALIITLSVIATFGFGSVVAVGVGGYFLLRNVGHARGHFSVAAKQQAVIDGMQPLVDKLNEQRRGSRV